jgi:Caspase domain/N-acetylmuramoyl-L-alanine amidase
MLGTITQIDPEQLRLLLQRGWTRRIDAVHVHHTWRPNHAQWRGQSTVEAIRRYHVEELGWSDIAQHLTVGRDGSLWTGRDLNRPPASIAGHNGTADEGPFMIEMNGDFDVGQDPFTGAQEQSVYQTVAEICARFGLSVDAIRFHNEFAPKSCPGSSLKLAEFRKAVHAVLQPIQASKAARVASVAARDYAGQVAAPASTGRALEAADAEPRYEPALASRSWGDDDGARGLGAQCTPEEVDVFHSHVVDLSGGQLSDSGCYKNSEADLDELIARIDKWVEAHAGAQARIVFFAHGGLVDEQSGLGIALRDYKWWLANDVYPVFFVWETGFLEELEQGWQQRRADAGARDFITDPLFEFILGPTVGRPTWDRIKNNAFLSSSEVTGTGGPGGAALFAHKLANWFTSPHPQAAKLEFHAAGHSAGSIFHCHFLPALEAAFKGIANAPKPIVTSLSLLAPAVRTDLFTQMLLPRVGGSIGACTMFTMKRQSELVDDVIKVYRKSLLYFVRNACEKPTPTPILGLEESVRADPALVQFFGLGAGKGNAQAVWSPTTAISGDAASRALHHGDFDNDSPTMNSMMRRILGLADAQPLPCTHLPVDDIRACSSGAPADGGRQLLMQPAPGSSMGTRAGGTSGNRSALCIGIDTYGSQSLTGCVADATSFADALRQWGFDVQSLSNERATRQAIATAIDGVLGRAKSGDVVVIQYAGHGTQLPDGNGDEADGLDEAWVPYDYNEGEFVIDDDIGALFDRYKGRGIQLVVFTDCCHSGTSTRFMPGPGTPESSVHSRYMQVPRDIVDAFQKKRGTSQAGARFGAQDSFWEIHFAACQDSQSAYERDGHGDFTRAATKALADAVQAATSYSALGEAIAKAFAGNTLQTPRLNVVRTDAGLPVFGASRALTIAPDAATQDGATAGLGLRLDQLTAAIDKLSKKIDDL